MTDQGQHLVAAAARLRATVKFLLWAYTPFQKLGPTALYDLLSTRAFTEKGLYLNLGYWERARTIDEACTAMANLIAETAAMGPADEVVDVGFGFAEQDILWTERFTPHHITGLNVTSSQVFIARERVWRRGFADRIGLLVGSAADMPLAAASCDIVTALECAFHFDTREQFFGEALRVLRPGGRLVLADVIRNAPATSAFSRAVQEVSWNTFARKFSVPQANADSRDTYTVKLRKMGFYDLRVTSIWQEVFPGWHRALGEDQALMRRLPLAGRIPYWLLRHASATIVYDAFDYVLVFARKPA
jgi:ubiquinone/menaquinone biosynthesis C-methylase UbiE